MKNLINLLIVEDERNIVTMYCDYIDSFNKRDEHHEIEVVICEDVEQGKSELEKAGGAFDCAIVDLRLKQNDGGSGNIIIEQMLETSRIPIVVMSGYVQELEDKFKENNLVRIYDKDGDLEEVFKYIVSLYKTGITKILGKRGLIDKYLDKVFWQYITRDIDQWISAQEHTAEVEKVMLRYTHALLQEYLGLKETQEHFENYLPLEMYIFPSILKKPFTGGIVYTPDNKRYVILTPSCDMAQDKGKWVTLVEIESLHVNSVFANMKNNVNRGVEKEESVESLKKITSNNYSLRYHFLPPTANFEGGLINFQKVQSVKLKDLLDQKKFSLVGNVTELFARDITARFSQYFGRQGQPDIYRTVLEQITLN